MRVLVDNDFSGDPDDLFQMAHHLLCPSVKIVGIIGSHLGPGDPFDSSPVSAANAVQRVGELLEVMGLTGTVPVFQGANNGLLDPLVPIRSDAVDALITEAMRDDELPLFLVCGAGLTDLASALLLEPRIADRMTVVWIGGQEYPDLAAPPPGAVGTEYNLKIDITAGITVFNHSRARLWQVPRDAYRQALVSQAELLTRVKPCGALGTFLYDAIQAVVVMAAGHGRLLGETYALGDSPLVLLTALQTPFESSPASSFFVERDTPTLLPDGGYGEGTGSRPIRIWTRLDKRLLFEDLFAKLALFAAQ
jgi:inosine-uridine nucleoside N-ribohydrolase